MKVFFPILFLLIGNVISNAQYLLYETANNHHGQTLIQTKDNGFLIAVTESCYIPHGVFIEGCPRGVYLIKTNESGDTLWTQEDIKSISYGVRLFEHEDGSFTLVGGLWEGLMCEEVYIAGFGGPRIAIYNLNAQGDITHHTKIPDDCQLSLDAIVSLSDTTYAVLAYYRNSGFVGEGQLFLMNKFGNISFPQIYLTGDYEEGYLAVTSQQEIILFYSDTGRILHLNMYDKDLNLLGTRINTELDSSCITSFFSWLNLGLRNDENLIVSCYEPEAVKSLELYSLDLDLNVQFNKKYTIPSIESFIENDEHEIILLSVKDARSDNADIQLNYFSAQGDSLYTRVIQMPENQYPTQLRKLENNKLVITGEHNCCYLADTNGLAKTFLYLGDLSTSIEADDVVRTDMVITPNPSGDIITVLVKDENTIKTHQAEMLIYSSTGVLVKKSMMQNNPHRTEISDLPDGIYFIVIKSGNTILKQERFVKI